jgi:penicillin-insensitive murein endopeptidase
VLTQPSPPSFEAALFKGGRAPIAVATAPEPDTVVPEPGSPPAPVLAGATGLPAVNAFAETPQIGVPVPRPRPGP